MKYLLTIIFLLFYIVYTTAQVSVVSEAMIDSLIKVSKIDTLYHTEQTELATRALRLANSIKYTTGIYDATVSLGRIKMNLGKYEKAILIYQKALKYAEEVDSIEFQAHAKYCIGNIYQKLYQFNNALTYFDESLAICEKLEKKRWIGILKNGIGAVYLQVNEEEKGVESLLAALTIFEENGMEEATGIPISNLAEQYYDNGQFEIAMQYYQKSLTIAKKYNNQKMQAIGHANFGLVLRQLKQYEESIVSSKTGLAIAEKYQYNKVIADISKDLAETYQKNGDFESSVKYYETFNEISDSLLGHEVKQEVDALQKAYEKEKKEKEESAKEQEIIQLKQAKQISQVINIGIISFLVFSSGFLWLFFSRNKAKRQLIEAELKNKELEKERLEKELNFKAQDLTNFALDISRKNDFAQRLHDRLEVLMDADPKEIKEKARKLYFLVANHLKINEDSKEFQMNIDTVNQDFYNKLNEKFPELTVNERQLCGLIRLNLTTKDIAAIKNISPKSVEMGRYRLRKKMKLDPNVEIANFMQKL
ncbi:MAG: tetratricopeptide (TPR) repeat protein [Paraglaciecola sp.]|jgi:tetratricopeptide (TPR) repeat protein